MKNLANTLSQMFFLSITNLETLREYPAIYENFFLQLDTFITTIVFCSKKNRNQLLELAQNFGISPSELPMLPRIKNTGLNKLILNETTFSKQLSSKISNILHRTKL